MDASVTRWRGKGRLELGSGEGEVSDLIFTDLDRNSNEDLIVGIANRLDQIWTNEHFIDEVHCEKDAPFVQVEENAYPSDLPDETTSLAVADFDGDDWLDLAVGTDSSSAYLPQNYATKSWSTSRASHLLFRCEQLGALAPAWP